MNLFSPQMCTFLLVKEKTKVLKIPIVMQGLMSYLQ